MEIYKKLLSRKLFYQLLLLFIGLIISTFFETLSFGSIIIFLGVLTEPELIISKFLSDNISNLSGEAFNFSLEIQMQVIEIVKLILDLCKKKLPIKILGDATNEISDMSLNCSKSKKILNWKPMYSFEKGLEETIDFYRHYLIK